MTLFFGYFIYFCAIRAFLQLQIFHKTHKNPRSSALTRYPSNRILYRYNVSSTLCFCDSKTTRQLLIVRTSQHFRQTFPFYIFKHHFTCSNIRLRQHIWKVISNLKCHAHTSWIFETMKGKMAQATSNKIHLSWLIFYNDHLFQTIFSSFCTDSF